MAGSIAKLVVTLAANVAGFETDMKRATSGQRKRMKEMEQAASAAGKAIAVAATAAATALTAIVVSSAKTADEMQKLALRTGLSTEALSEYKYAAELSGLSMEQLTGGIRKMQRSISDADQGLATQARAFERLGISVNDLIKLSPDQQFEMIAEALSGLESATLRSATAQEIFGRSGSELLSIMGNGAEGIRQLREEAQRFGVTISGEFAANAERFNDNFERMGALARGAGQQLTAGMLPAMIALQEEFLGAANATDLFFRAGQKLGEVLRVITAAFIIVKNAALGFGKVLLGLIDLIANIARGLIAPITGAVKSLIDAFAALKAGDLTAAAEAMKGIGSSIGAEFDAAADRVKTAGGFILETVGNLDDGLAEANKMFTATAANLGKTTTKFKENAAAIEKASAAVKTLDEAKKKLGARLKLLEGQWDDINATLDEVIAQQEKLAAETQAYEDALKGLLDELYPVEAAGRRLGESLAILTRAHREGALSWDEYQDAVNRAVSGFEKAASGVDEVKQEIDLLAVAMDEGARIMERIFQDLFTGIIDDSTSAFDAIQDGFKSLIGRMNSEAARGIQMEFQTAFGEGGGGFEDVNWGSVALQFGQIAASAFADDVVRGIFGDQDYGTDYVEIGKQIGTVVGAIVGSFIPVIGTALGAIIGAFSGAMHGWVFGKLFGREFGAILGGREVADTHGAADDAQVLKTALADVIGISGQGGFGDLNDPNTPGGKIGIAIQQFDQAIYDILEALDAAEEFDAIVDALESWKGAVDAGTNDVEALLTHRFRAILDTMDAHIKDFALAGEGLEDQITRFGVGLQVNKLFELMPDALAGRTQAEFLALVDKYATGFKNINEAMKEVSQAFIQVVGLIQFLKEFSASDLISDYNAMLEIQGRTLTQALSNVNEKLFDAVTNFDGSIESLQEIAGLVSSSREGELKLLQQIDAIQKGLNANLDTLKAEILGLQKGPQTGEQLFNQAQNLIGSIRDSSTVEDVAGIEQEFNAIIRQMSPEDMEFFGDELIAIIELFRSRANEVLDLRRNEAIASADSTRQLIDEFIVRVGDPLDIIAAAVENNNLPEVMEDGLSRIDATVATIGPQVSNAIVAGLSGISINVTTGGADGYSTGLVTQ